MNIARKLFFAFMNFRRYQCSVSRNLPVVKILCLDDENSLKITFKYSRSKHLVVRAPKDESVQTALARIKLMASLQLKREEIRQVVMNKYSNSAQVAIEEAEEDIMVNLIQNDSPIEENISNIEAWSWATQLKVGDIVYDIKYNLPTVVILSLPNYILSDCFIRPRFKLECADFESCSFIWYRSLAKDNITNLSNSDTKNILIEEDKYWLKVGEGFAYKTCSEDVGCFLKVVCTPKFGDKTGFDFSAESISVVQKIPKIIPFEERHRHTNFLTDDESLRCVSYNTLANTYVEKKKFPYSSVKALDSYYRKQLLLKELIGYNSDILCLQEVEERCFTYDIYHILKEYCFEGYYKRKGGRRYEGLATFFNTKKFQFLDHKSVLLNEIIVDDVCKDLRQKVGRMNKDISTLLKQESALQILLLQHKNNPTRKVLVANTHLYSNKDTPEVRLIQAAVCTSYIEHFKKIKGLSSTAILFCGDFNSLPSSDTYDFITSGKSYTNSKNGSNVSETLLHSLDLDSACGTPEYTNFTEEFKGCLDYIFYGKEHLKVTEIVPMPKHEDVKLYTGLPSEIFPSDHIALVCTLKWNN